MQHVDPILYDSLTMYYRTQCFGTDNKLILNGKQKKMNGNTNI
jgi:hypothetical protein